LPISNLYKFPAGPELDELIHCKLFRAHDREAVPEYSTDHRYVRQIAARLQTFYRKAVSTGTLRLGGRKFFARFESGPSTATEAVGETLPLAICRLALIIIENYGEVEDD
jgi:hypothetical protein